MVDKNKANNKLQVTGFKKKKVMTVVGTRPEIIRLSEVIKKLDEYTNHILVHTGQNYDYELNEIFFRDLNLRQPDHYLDADRSSLGATIGDIIKKSEEVLKKEEPDALLVLGDTNSCLFAYMAKRMHIPIYHMEAGNRCFDFRVPEETNRKIIDHIADVNLVYTEHARRHLLSEGLLHNRIFLTGSPMNEVLQIHMDNIKNSKILNELSLERNEYFLVSTHREENVDDPDNLNKILNVFNKLIEIYELPIIVSTHPRTRKRIESLNPSLIAPHPSHITHNPSPITHNPSPITHNPSPITHNPSPITHNPSLFTHHSLLRFLKPFGFIDYNHLQMNAKCVISDSGTISEESAILSFPAISLRESMERPEAQDAGTIVLTGFDPDMVLNSIATVIDEHKKRSYKNIPNEYQINDTSWRVIKLILGNIKLS